MKKYRIVKALPEVFSLKGNDYGHFVVKGGAEQMMREAWTGVGTRLSAAMTTVGSSLPKEKKKASANVWTKESA